MDHAKTDGDELLTYGEAARFLRISTEHLRRLKMLGRVPAHKPFGGRVLFLRTELEQIVRASRTPESVVATAPRPAKPRGRSGERSA